MATTNRTPSRRGAKSLLAVLSLATTLGGWAWLSLSDEQAETARDTAPAAVTAEGSKPVAQSVSGFEATLVIELPPMPTLVPLVVPATVELLEIAPQRPARPPAPAGAPVPLRIVAAPPPLPTQAPERDQPAPEPVAKTRSSR